MKYFIVFVHIESSKSSVYFALTAHLSLDHCYLFSDTTSLTKCVSFSHSILQFSHTSCVSSGASSSDTSSPGSAQTPQLRARSHKTASLQRPVASPRDHKEHTELRKILCLCYWFGIKETTAAWKRCVGQGLGAVMAWCLRALSGCGRAALPALPCGRQLGSSLDLVQDVFITHSPAPLEAVASHTIHTLFLLVTSPHPEAI